MHPSCSLPNGRTRRSDETGTKHLLIVSAAQVLDEDCVKKNAPLFKELGKKALIVTGRHSA
jgi:hypothetical protein